MYFTKTIIAFVSISILLHTGGCNTTTKTFISDQSDTVIYESEAYSIYSHSVVDSAYGGLAEPAFIPTSNAIYSPVRIVPKGKTTVLDTSKTWHPTFPRDHYPYLRTHHPSIDATYNLALDVLYRCHSGEFVRNTGEEGLWQAGFRQGEGYGVWIRDVAYVSLLMGSFLEPEVAQKSIEYTTNHGIDNGEDGLALPAIAAWNHFLVTGDSSILKRNYERLKLKVSQILFDSARNLGFAHSGSFIDSRKQPEAGGFPLSTNIVYMMAYDAMYEIGKVIGEPNERTLHQWKTRTEVMLETIRKEYFNSESGYFTFGPKGSESYTNHHWENLGVSLAIWPQLGIASNKQRLSVLKKSDIAYSPYGFCDLNYLNVPGDNGLHGQQVWPFTEVGIMAALAKEKKIDHVLELLASVVRSAAIHKTFYECIDWNTGKAWRYPGQLWHASAFISMIHFGILGMEYDASGITFPNACVPEALSNLTIESFSYRNADLTILVSGWGIYDGMELDGQSVTIVPTDLKGEHQLIIHLKEP